MTMLSIFQWCETTALAIAIKNSDWAFAVIESFHLLGLAVIGGTVLLVNLRLLGLGFRGQPVSQVAHDTHPWFIGSLVVMLTSGSLMFLSEAVKCYYSESFLVKMASLFLAIIFTFTTHRRLVMSEGTTIGPHWQKLAAVISLALWFTVGAAGRWIGFSG
jgi:uncharacterized protein DUF6644